MIDKRLIIDFVQQWFGLIRSNKIQIEAAAMAFVSLLSLVPILILSGWLVSVLVPPEYYSLQQIESILMQLIIPESAQAIAEYLAHILSQSKSMSIVSMLILLPNILILVINLQQALNGIFAVRARSFIKKITSLLITIVIGLPLLAMALAASEIPTTFAVLGWVDVFTSFVFTEIAPLSIEILVMTSLYLLVPARSPGWKLALLGGFMLTLILLCLRTVLEKIIVELGSYELLYGIFASVPLFFIWVYGFWVSLFIVATFLHCMQTVAITRNQ